MTSKQVQTIKDYFEFCVDGKATERVGEYFAADALIHRPDCGTTLRGLEEFEAKLKSCVTERYESVKTTFQRVIETEGEVVVALTHKAENSNTWMGFDVSGKDVTWTSLTYFRFNNEGKIIEEIVERNELSMANQLGLHLDITKERN
ncbi:ester cyclase [Vibrio mediterranei]|jgi:predicted ester cyclase|uniref:ester cyclase n=1 Tax=Vibrio mediterranei TaxID=689 RepID=UPI000D187787|nr:ester cyclase [Vibrio mediterranei]MCG9661242.1 ester cyclase [Vibrio mediterranei]MCG9664907.1 ester cyclase [Vibrio mediterranei]PTC04542.1 polyketide cyclase [Vibrio mediterranei]